MPKLMFALWGAALDETLHDPALREALAGAGVSRVQINIDDAPVAEAMRIPTFETPIGAVMSVWDGEPDAVVAALAGAADRVAGWEVTERRPLAPDEVWDGTRLDGLANLALLRRPSDLSHDDWLHRWQIDHTPVAIATQATFGYVQNTVVAAVTPDAPALAALVEELFPSGGITDIHAFYGSAGDDAELRARIERLMTSVARFGADRDIDLVPTSRYLYDLAR